ncbi:MAG: hypothetical protein Q9M28_11430 [Mariprofundaceae bacterium]|nr:hypothetical protein [Mariprofundaceae bacterium]
MEGRYAGIVTFHCAGVDQASLYHRLMQAGVMCAYRGGGIRFSPHFYTPYAVLERAMSIVLEA